MTLHALTEDVRTALRRGPATPAEIAATLGAKVRDVRQALAEAVEHGIALHQVGGRWRVGTSPQRGADRADVATLTADRSGRLVFGAIGDTHLGSKYERLDCLHDYYDLTAARGIRHVLHAGNWIDGEARFNTHDIHVHGMDAQLQYLAREYPRRKGVETWAITGADHEGWYARTAGVDIGRYAARVMEEAGRTDWRDLGYMETYIRVVHPATGKGSMLCLMHPGGGSAYAISYAPQKIVEAFDGGDKPAVLLIGHYHKASYQLTRNVHAIQVGCFEDQTPFMRQKKLSAHLGGMFVEIELDPRTGAVVECSTAFRNYYVKDYYVGRWSQHGPVKNPPRQAAKRTGKTRARVVS